MALSPSTDLFPLFPRLRRRSRCSGTSHRGEDRYTFTLLHAAAILRRSLQGGGLLVLADWPRQSCGEGAARGAARRDGQGRVPRGLGSGSGLSELFQLRKEPKSRSTIPPDPLPDSLAVPGAGGQLRGDGGRDRRVSECPFSEKAFIQV